MGSWCCLPSSVKSETNNLAMALMARRLKILPQISEFLQNSVPATSPGGVGAGWADVLSTAALNGVNRANQPTWQPGTRTTELNGCGGAAGKLSKWKSLGLKHSFKAESKSHISKVHRYSWSRVQEWTESREWLNFGRGGSKVSWGIKMETTCQMDGNLNIVIVRFRFHTENHRIMTHGYQDFIHLWLVSV